VYHAASSVCGGFRRNWGLGGGGVGRDENPGQGRHDSPYNSSAGGRAHG